MKRYIEKYFLFLLFFIFTLSLVNITSTFALGKTADILPSVKKFITKGVDTEACKKKDITKAGIGRYLNLTICRTQCTSKDAKYTKFKADNKEDCEFLVGAGGTSGTGAVDAGSGTDGTDTKEDPVKNPNADTKTENSSLTEDDINNADLSTKEAFDKIKKVFDVTVARIPHTDFNSGKASLNTFTSTIGYLGLVPVRVTITHKAVDLDATEQILLEELLTQRILALAAKAPTTLGEDADADASPVPGSLYELIYKGAVDGLDKTGIAHINTKPNVIEVKHSTVGDIVNTAKVIAVRKGPVSDTIDILLELDTPGYVSGFEKLSGVTFSYAHIADPAATGAAFVAPENFVAGLVPGTEAKTECPVEDTLFVDRLNNHPTCKNLLKITVPTDTTAEFGIPDAPIFASGDFATHIQAAAQAAKTVEPVIILTWSLGSILWILTTYFNPDAAQGDANYIYASDAIKDQLKSPYLMAFTNAYLPSHYWPASEHVQAALVTLPAQDPNPAQAAKQKNTIFLLRVAGDPKSVYLTKKINAPAPDPAPSPEETQILASLDKLAEALDTITLDDTPETFTKIKELFEVSVEKVPHTDLGTADFPTPADVDQAIERTAVIPVRINILPKGVTAPDATKPAFKASYDAKTAALRSKLGEKLSNLAIISKSLGAYPHTAPVKDSLYEFIHNEVVKLVTIPNIKYFYENQKYSAHISEIVNAWVIAAKKGTSDILLRFAGSLPADIEFPFAKLGNVRVTHASIKDASLAADKLLLPDNFVDHLAEATTATTDCAIRGFYSVVAAPTARIAACRNLLKIEGINRITANLGIPDGAADGISTAAGIASDSKKIAFYLRALEATKKFTTYFDPTLGEADPNYLYASDAIRIQLKDSKNVEGFPSTALLTHNFAAPVTTTDNAGAHGVIDRNPAAGTSFVALFRVVGNDKVVYLTKLIQGANP